MITALEGLAGVELLDTTQKCELARLLLSDTLDGDERRETTRNVTTSA